MPEDKEMKIELSNQVKEAMAGDPALSAALTELFANMRQAQHAIDEGRYATFDDAMAAITGNRPELIATDDLEDDDELTAALARIEEEVNKK